MTERSETRATLIEYIKVTLASVSVCFVLVSDTFTESLTHFLTIL